MGDELLPLLISSSLPPSLSLFLSLCPSLLFLPPSSPLSYCCCELIG